MVRDIVKDKQFLTEEAINCQDIDLAKKDSIIEDLIDTANVYKDSCVGLAAPQIGELKKVFVVLINDKFVPFINPKIFYYSPDIYKTKEGCLSVDGTALVERHKEIKVSYFTKSGKKKIQSFNGLVAEIIQHEYDHLKGILIK